MKIIIENIKLEIINLKHHVHKVWDEKKVHMKKKEHRCEMDNIIKTAKPNPRCNFIMNIK